MATPYIKNVGEPKHKVFLTFTRLMLEQPAVLSQHVHNKNQCKLHSGLTLGYVFFHSYLV